MGIVGVVPGPQWKELARALRGRTALFIGATDTGKSTLARYVLSEALARGEAACLVDSDIGQSSLGLPGTVSMRTFRDPAELEDFRAERMIFVGTLNPAKQIPAVVEGAARMAQSARETLAALAGNARTILVDTTGLVLGEGGRALKLAKMRAVGATDMVALERPERKNELEHILNVLEGAHIHRLRASRLAKEKSREARAAYREGRFRAYFEGAGLLEVPLRGVEFVAIDRPFDVRTSPVVQGALAGLFRGWETAALGVYMGIQGNRILMKSPLKDPAGVKKVLFGDIML